MQLPEASRPGAKASGRLQATLDDMGKWTPTLELAMELQRQLAAHGRLGTAEQVIKPPPGITDRTYSVQLENWLAPIRAWYNDTTPVTDYAGLTAPPDTIVCEVGVSNYEIAIGHLLLQGHAKVIDAASGRVIGRARASNSMQTSKGTPLDLTFANGAKGFKAMCAKEGRRLIANCLTELGFAP